MDTFDTITTAAVDRFIDEALAETDLKQEVTEMWRHEMRRLVRGRIRLAMDGCHRTNW
jgi:hypothetical protein